MTDMTELFESPAAGFDDPIEILDGCHHRIRRNCACIERIVAHVAKQGADEEARIAAASVLRYFDTAGRDHHRDEEDDLFPALYREAPPAGRPGVERLLERLRADHRVLDALWERVRPALEAITQGRDPGLTAGLAALFTETFTQHIACEETELLPLARRLLSPATLSRLGVAMAARRGVSYG